MRLQTILNRREKAIKQCISFKPHPSGEVGRGLLFFLLFLSFNAFSQKYQPTWESLDSRPVAPWFGEAKFGIFVHWGVYSVPGYRPAENGKWDGIYAEWYGPDVMYKPERNDSFHIRNYGKDFEYRDFAKLFKAELYDPAKWADIIASSGAKYTILTTKHCDGYTMYATNDPVSKNWNSVENGPGRDLYGELLTELRKKDLKVGAYYAWMEYENTDSTGWPHNEARASERTGYYIPKPIFDKYTVGDKAYIEHCHYQMKELINKYQIDILWADAAWDRPASYWKSRELLTWVYNESPMKDKIVVNDRWDNAEKRHGGYVTTEYGTGTEGLEHGRPWEECQGMGYSFGINRAENLEQYRTGKQLIQVLVETVSKGGNLLLNIGPNADGTIPVIMQERLAQIGKWLKTNGEAIYASKMFANAQVKKENPSTFFTWKNGSLYAICMKYPVSGLKLDKLKFAGKPAVSLIGSDKKVVFSVKNDQLSVTAPQLSPDDYQDAYVVKIENVKNE